jgi:peptide methionine sulfoxide reductase msrA/msrB
MSYIDKIASFPPHIYQVVIEERTEYPHTGVHRNSTGPGTYLCRRCGIALFRGSHQFASSCGWPAFDNQCESAISEIPDKDGRRVEILCSRCDAHLGHVFRGEYATHNNIRHCVNSVSLDFVEDSSIEDSAEIIVAGGCFWGVEYYFQKEKGVVLFESGYSGGTIQNPSYDEVCQGNSGHYEAVRIVYNVNVVSLQTILKLFFEIHDPEQSNGQGPDIGSQYHSAVFAYNEEQQKVAQVLLQQLRANGYQPATQVLPVATFWSAEDFHQQYYLKHAKTPYCHRRVKRFD